MREQWREATLGECFTLVNDKVDPRSVPSSYPYVGMEHITSQTPRVETHGEAGSVTSEVARFEPGDTLFGRLRPYLRKVARAHFDGVCSPEVLVLRAKPEIALPDYLYLLASSDSAIGHAVALSAGSRMPRTSAADLASLPVDLPTVSEQRRIVDLIGAIDEAITALDHEIAAGDAVSAALRAELMRPKEGWTETTVGSLAEIFDGPHATPRKTEEGPWYLSISSLHHGEVDLTYSAHLSPEDFVVWTRRVAPKRSDTLFSYETRLGEAAFWDSDSTAALGRRMGILRPRLDIVEPRFLTYLYLSPTFQRVIEDRAVRGSTVDRIPIIHLGDWPISAPPLDQQRTIILSLTTMDETLRALRDELHGLSYVRSATVQRLLRGDHQIPLSYDAMLVNAN